MLAKAVIKPANPEEEVLGLIAKMRSENLTEAQKNYINKHKDLAIASFRHIVRNRFGLSDKQMCDLGEERLQTLFRVMSDKSKWRLWYNYPLHFFPVTLFLICISNNAWSPYFNLARSANKLRKTGCTITGHEIMQNIVSFESSDLHYTSLHTRNKPLT